MKKEENQASRGRSGTISPFKCESTDAYLYDEHQSFEHNRGNRETESDNKEIW